jgi:23S rRNA A1618 N6-methylase RlmF
MLTEEIDEESLRHAQAVAKQNKVEIELVKTTAMDPILKPLYDGATVSFSLCNPPFFASKDEMQAGSDLKALIAPAVSHWNVHR